MSRPYSVPGVFSGMEIAASGLTAERGRMNVIASNLANARTTRAADGQPYKRLDPIFSAKAVATMGADPVLSSIREVQLSGVRPDATPGEMVYDPGHPDANPQGYVQNLMTASRAYEAGVTSVESLKSMARSALKIGQ
jgi:flagellar basal-body rod protein FlgC